MKRMLRIVDYPNLYGLGLYNIKEETFKHLFIELVVGLENFPDCLYLLDGRFNQLRTFNVKINSIHYPLVVMNNKEKIANLRSFSLTCPPGGGYYKVFIVPLVHRMLNLEELDLCIWLTSTDIFIDGNNLKKNIIDHLPRLNKFLFNIFSTIYFDQDTYLPSNEEIQQTFINFMNNKVITCVDYFPKKDSGQCHTYSYPYTMNYYRKITNNFPGGLFTYVREVSLFDESPFEHEFFLRIAQSFPFLKVFSVNNPTSQKHKQCQTSNDDKQDPLIIKYFHLIDVRLLCVHADYVEQFLDPTKTSILNNMSLYVDYYRLRKATHNFKRNDMRINCSKVTNLRLFGTFQIPEHFKAYFPNVKHQ